ncbi:hypothetical protein ACFYOD_09310 [Streptomyces sp. NPDC006703]|uniref:hypothetical protein n=1 Tax=Streptomyces sp. NPDC006703 TaxID=3364759 RepID=UPI0036C271D7
MTPPSRTARKPTPAECSVCKGTGEVPITVRVGRKRRPVGQQNGYCLTCLGTGYASTD